MDHSRKRSGAGSLKKWRRNGFEDFYNTRKDCLAAFLVKSVKVPQEEQLQNGRQNEPKCTGKVKLFFLIAIHILTYISYTKLKSSGSRGWVYKKKLKRRFSLKFLN